LKEIEEEKGKFVLNTRVGNSGVSIFRWTKRNSFLGIWGFRA